MRHRVKISAPITAGTTMQAKELLFQATTDLQTLTVVKIPHIFVIKISYAFLRHRISTFAVDLELFIVWKESQWNLHCPRDSNQFLNRCQPSCMTSCELGPSLQQTSSASSKLAEILQNYNSFIYFNFRVSCRFF